VACIFVKNLLTVFKREIDMSQIKTDPDIIRELIFLKAKDLGLEENSLIELDELVCKLINIKNPEPFIYPV
jgi:hypothetical protein